MRTPAKQGETYNKVNTRGLAHLANKIVTDIRERWEAPAEDRPRPKYYDPSSREGKAEQKRKDIEAAAKKVEEEAAAVVKAAEDAKRAIERSVVKQFGFGGQRLGAASDGFDVKDELAEGDDDDQGPGTSHSYKSIRRDAAPPAPIAKRPSGKTSFRGSGNRLGDPLSTNEGKAGKSKARKTQPKVKHSVKDEVDADFMLPLSPSSAPQTLGSSSRQGKKRPASPSPSDDAAELRRKRMAAIEARMAVKQEIKAEP